MFDELDKGESMTDDAMDATIRGPIVAIEECGESDVRRGGSIATAPPMWEMCLDGTLRRMSKGGST
jgi:hypothetical protein